MSVGEIIVSVVGAVPIVLFLCLIFSEELAQIIRAFRDKR